MVRTDNSSVLMEIRKGKTGRGLLLEHDGGIDSSQDSIMQVRDDIRNHKEFVIPDHFVVSAIFQKYGIKNANGRIYPESILRPEVEKYIRERVETRSSIGALDHPEQSALSGHDVSHVITSLEWNSHTLVGRMELHLSPGYRRYGVCSTSGDLVANMLIDGITIGVSSRGVGNVEDKMGVMMVTEYDLVGWDVVCEPSTPGAYISADMNDLRRFVEDEERAGSVLAEKAERALEILNG